MVFWLPGRDARVSTRTTAEMQSNAFMRAGGFAARMKPETCAGFNTCHEDIA